MMSERKSLKPCAHSSLPVAEYAVRCGVDESLLRAAVRRLAAADSVAVCEDLGVQLNRHSTMNSWLEKLLWILTGNFAKPGSQYLPSALIALIRTLLGRGANHKRKSNGT